MNAKPSCIVIGAGIMGAAAAYFLAKQGAQVRLLEQFGLYHTKGSSHGKTRLFRTAYFEHADYVPLLQRSATLWQDLEQVCGEKLLHLSGVFMAGGADTALISGTRKAAKDYGLSIENLDAGDIAQRFPWFAIPSSMECFIEPDAGLIRADLALAAFLDGARAHGAQLYANCTVKEWRPHAKGIEAVTKDETFCADRLIITPGAWGCSLLGHVGDLIKPLQKTLLWTAAGDSAFDLGGPFLPFAIEQPDGRFFYGFPAVDPDGVKFGEHTGGAPIASADDTLQTSKQTDRLDGMQFLKDLVPGLPISITKEQSCLYEMSPDEHFIIDCHPDDDRVSFAIGHSGHGFKFAPVIGEALAALALTGEARSEFDFLKLARFGAL